MPRRLNYRGRPLIFPLGIVLIAVAGLALTAGLNRWLVFLIGVGWLGLLDDLAGGGRRGWRGHGEALARGQVSTGAIKAAGTLAFAAYAAAGTEAAGAEYLAQVLLLALAAHLGNELRTSQAGACRGIGSEAEGPGGLDRAG